MELIVEFTGAAQIVTSQKKVRVTLEPGSTYQDLVRRLAKLYPGLVGFLIDVDGETLMSGNLLIINGDLETPAMVMQEHPADGTRLILMSLVTGG